MKQGGIARSAAVNLTSRMALGILGFVQSVLLAHTFGASTSTDAFIVALWLPVFFGNVGDSVLVYSLVPHLVSLEFTEGEESRRRTVDCTFTWFLILLIVFALGLLALAPLVVRCLVPGFSDEACALTGRLLRQLTPTLVVGGLAGFLASLLYARGRFGAAAAGAVLPSVGTITLILLVKNRWGIAAPALGYMLGVLAQFLVVLSAVAKSRDIPRLSGWNRGELSRVGKLVAPRFGGVAVNRAVLGTDRFFASMLGPGAVSLLSYSYAIALIPVTLAVAALGKTLVPYQAREAAEGGVARLRSIVSRTVGLALFSLAPVVFLMIYYRTPLIRLIFERGAFTAEDTAASSRILFCYALGILFQAVAVLFSGTFFSLNDTWTPFKVTSLSFVVNAVCDFIFMQIFGLPGIAMSTAMVGAVSMACLGWLLIRRIGPLETREILRSAAGVAGAVGTMAVTMWLLTRFVVPYLGSGGRAGQVAQLCGSAFVALGVFVLTCRALRVGEYQYLEIQLRRKPRRGVTGPDAAEPLRETADPGRAIKRAGDKNERP